MAKENIVEEIGWFFRNRGRFGESTKRDLSQKIQKIKASSKSYEEISKYLNNYVRDTDKIMKILTTDEVSELFNSPRKNFTFKEINEALKNPLKDIFVNVKNEEEERYVFELKESTLAPMRIALSMLQATGDIKNIKEGFSARNLKKIIQNKVLFGENYIEYTTDDKTKYIIDYTTNTKGQYRYNKGDRLYIQDVVKSYDNFCEKKEEMENPEKIKYLFVPSVFIPAHEKLCKQHNLSQDYSLKPSIFQENLTRLLSVFYHLCNEFRLPGKDGEYNGKMDYTKEIRTVNISGQTASVKNIWLDYEDIIGLLKYAYSSSNEGKESPASYDEREINFIVGAILYPEKKGSNDDLYEEDKEEIEKAKEELLELFSLNDFAFYTAYKAMTILCDTRKQRHDLYKIHDYFVKDNKLYINDLGVLLEYGRKEYEAQVFEIKSLVIVNRNVRKVYKFIKHISVITEEEKDQLIDEIESNQQLLEFATGILGKYKEDDQIVRLCENKDYQDLLGNICKDMVQGYN